MLSKLHIKFIWTILFWFAILQAVAPLIHAHVEADTPQQGHGIHMHSDDITQIRDKVPTLRINLGFSDTIGVDKALVKDVKVLPMAIFIFLFLIYDLIIHSQKYNLVFSFREHPPFYLKSSSRPRAPPFF